VSDYQDFRPPGAPLAMFASSTPEMAGRGARLWAKLVDFLVLGCAFALAGGIAILVQPGGLKAVLVAFEEPGISLTSLLLGLAAAVVVWNWVWLHHSGQTIGKRALGVRIVQNDGTRAPLWRILFLRDAPATAIARIPLLGDIIALVDILFIFRADRRCLHDMIAGTKVIRAERSIN